MVLKRSKGYQDIDGGSGSNPSTSTSELVDPDTVIPQEIEMASVSVVPDGNLTSRKKIYIVYDFLFFRYIYSNTSCKCTRVWVVPSKVIALDGAMLDG